MHKYNKSFQRKVTTFNLQTFYKQQSTGDIVKTEKEISRKLAE